MAPQQHSTEVYIKITKTTDIESASVYSATILGKTISVTEPSQVAVAIAHKKVGSFPHMGIIMKNRFSINGKSCNYGLIHCTPTEIRLEFDNNLNKLKYSLQRWGGLECFVGPFEPNYTPLSKFTESLHQICSMNGGDGIHFDGKALFKAQARGPIAEQGISVSINALQPVDNKHINCKRFVQYLANDFGFKVPEEIQCILEKVVSSNNQNTSRENDVDTRSSPNNTWCVIL